MKLQIDTTAKTIKVENQVKITELLYAIKKLLPNEWKEYSLEAVTVINNWANPIIIDNWPPYPYPYPTWQLPHTICDTGTINLDLSTTGETVCSFQIREN